MKKLIVIILFSIISFLPLSVSASDETTKNLFINIDVNIDGSINVQELAVLNGDYNGRFRSIYYKNSKAKSFTGIQSDFEGSDIYNGSNITDLKVYEVAGTNLRFNDLKKKINEYRLVSSASVGQKGVYTYSELDGGFMIKAFNTSSTGTSFYLEYKVKDAVVIHEDVAELAWNVLGYEYEENIEDLEVHVNLPEEDSSMRAWLKGPLNGYLDRSSDQTVIGTYDFLGAYNAVSVRMMFDKNLVPNATKFSNVEGKENILAVEKMAAYLANQKREKIRRTNNIVIIGTIIWFGLAILSVGLLLKKKKDTEKVEFDHEYYRNFPAEYGPEILQYLINQNIDSKGMSTSILAIINKKAFKVELNEKNKDDYTLVYQKEYEKDLTENEQRLAKFFIEKIGNGSEVKMQEIKKYGKTISKAKLFMKNYEVWVFDAKKEAKTYNFFDSAVGNRVFAVLMGLIGILATILNTALETKFIPGYLAFVPGIVLLLYTAILKIRTKEGALQYKKWMAFKKFLLDFGNMDEKQLPEIILWEKYLVYAAILGCAKEVEKAMKIRVEAMGAENDIYLHNYFYTNSLIRGSIYSSVNSGVNSAVSSSRSSIIASQTSSSGGFSGGSSGGGGSFGGGGGGGRF